ncbi:MAG: hypothetical protein ACRD09_02025 [Vicinamibacterales bacterium]
MNQVHPVYRRALAAAAARIEHRGEVAAAGPGTSRLAVAADGVSLTMLVEEAFPRLVRDARHEGASGDEEAVIDRLCAVMIGRPLYEAVHHGIVRVEAALRDASMPGPVPGVVSPRNAGPIFDRPSALLRTLRGLVGPLPVPPEQRSAWDDRPAPGWLALSREDQAARVHAAFADALHRMQIDIPVPEIVEITDGIRVVIAPHEADHRAPLGRALIAIERHVQATLDPRLELQFESLTDRNRRAERVIRLTSDHAAS